MYNFGGSFDYLSDIHKINFLQRAILIHSFLYYEMDKSVITDKEFDDVCKQYVKMVRNYDEEYIVVNSEYGYAFFDFDGSTGFHLWDRLIQNDKDKIKLISHGVLKQFRRKK